MAKTKTNKHKRKMNETIYKKFDTKKDELNTTYKFIAKKQHKYMYNDLYIIADVYNDVRKDFLSNDGNINARFMKPQISFKSIILSQNKNVLQFINDINENLINALKNVDNKTLIKDTFLKIDSKNALENFIYMCFGVENDHITELKNEITPNEKIKNLVNLALSKKHLFKSFDDFFKQCEINLINAIKDEKLTRKDKDLILSELKKHNKQNVENEIFNF